MQPKNVWALHFNADATKKKRFATWMQKVSLKLWFKFKKTFNNVLNIADRVEKTLCMQIITQKSPFNVSNQG